ncbi:MAG: hypothetical protein JXB03_07220 [Spirochaetales bacterium]|nr:hypothetical protein [Spirochaetales bacterium]
MDELEFNGEKLTSNKVSELLSRLLSPSVLTSNGGYLFKFAIGPSAPPFMLNMSPALQEGERRYHYHLYFRKDIQKEIIGGISPVKELQLLFKEQQPDSGSLAVYRQLYREFCMLIPLMHRKELKTDFATGLILTSYFHLPDGSINVESLLGCL